jgi:sirohydrochlorin cobaltochelatase
MPPAGERVAVLLVGHGAPATDCPPRLIGELMSLLFAGGGHGPGGHAPAAPGHSHGAMGERAAELDAQIRRWPRRADNDPYKAGLEQVAAALARLVPTELFAIAYNEFCLPTIAAALADLAGRGATRVLVVPSMLTPGGVHSEIDIPAQLQQAGRAHPDVRIDYLWPFPVEHVAALLADQVRRALAPPVVSRPS